MQMEGSAKEQLGQQQQCSIRNMKFWVLLIMPHRNGISLSANLYLNFGPPYCRWRVVQRSNLESSSSVVLEGNKTSINDRKSGCCVDVSKFKSCLCLNKPFIRLGSCDDIAVPQLNFDFTQINVTPEVLIQAKNKIFRYHYTLPLEHIFQFLGSALPPYLLLSVQLLIIMLV